MAEAHPRAPLFGCYLEQPGLLGRDAENSYLAAADLEAGTMTRRLGSSITYHIAIRPRKGRKVFTLQTLPSCDEPIDGGFGKGLYSPCNGRGRVTARTSNGYADRLSDL